MFSMRPVRPEDEGFLLKLYRSTRQDEIATWGWDEVQQDAFLRMQFAAQRRWYEAAYPQAEHQLILQEGEAVGRILVLRETAAIQLIDIALLPQYRNRGVGTALLGELIEESSKSGIPLRLHVQRSNQQAIRLYRRLGFSAIEQDEVYCRMERRS
jgi:ribosomal protein S18 acetylase RimI-like enzyme